VYCQVLGNPLLGHWPIPTDKTVSRELALEYCYVFTGQVALRDFDSCHRRCRRDSDSEFQGDANLYDPHDRTVYR
jgi:hypothetical protein